MHARSPHSVHIASTLEQSESEIWHILRAKKITASQFKSWANAEPSSLEERVWGTLPDLSKNIAVQYGRDHEEVALQDASNALHAEVRKCGLFLSKKIPYIGARCDHL